MIECPICNKSLKQLHGSHIKTHNMTTLEFKQKFPNISLRNESGYLTNTKNKQKRIKDENIRCKQCNILICSVDRNRRSFCSHSCSATYINSKRTEGRRNFKCLNCDLEIDSKYKRKFCSTSCDKQYKLKQHENRKHLIFEAIENGEELTYSLQTIQSWFKKYLIEKYGNECMICGWKEVNQFTGRVPIEIDHIDGDCDNNCLDNFQLVCPNCHSLTKHYKGGNSTYRDKGKQSSRYKYWKDNFST